MRRLVGSPHRCAQWVRAAVASGVPSDGARQAPRPAAGRSAAVSPCPSPLVHQPPGSAGDARTLDDDTPGLAPTASRRPIVRARKRSSPSGSRMRTPSSATSNGRWRISAYHLRSGRGRRQSRPCRTSSLMVPRQRAQHRPSGKRNSASRTSSPSPAATTAPAMPRFLPRRRSKPEWPRPSPTPAIGQSVSVRLGVRAVSDWYCEQRLLRLGSGDELLFVP